MHAGQPLGCKEMSAQTLLLRLCPAHSAFCVCSQVVQRMVGAFEGRCKHLYGPSSLVRIKKGSKSGGGIGGTAGGAGKGAAGGGQSAAGLR